MHPCVPSCIFGVRHPVWGRICCSNPKIIICPEGLRHTNYQRNQIYPYPMVWPLPRPWSETMVSIPLWALQTLCIKGFLSLARPFLDLVLQTPRPRGRGRPLFAEISEPQSSTPVRYVIFPTRYRENGHFEALPLRVAIFPVSRGKKRISQGVEDWGSQIGVP